MAIKRNKQLKTSSNDEFSSIKASCNAPDVDFTLCIYREGIRSDLAVLEACRESAGDSIIEVAIDPNKALPQYGSEINKAIVSRLPDECLGEQLPLCSDVLAEPKESVGLNLVLAFGRDPDRKRFFNLYDDVFSGLSEYENFVWLSSLRLDPVDCNTEEESVRREIDKDRRRCLCFSGKEKCKLFVPERGKRTELVKAGKDFEIVDKTVEADRDVDRYPLGIEFREIYPDWVKNGSDAVWAAEHGLMVHVCSQTRRELLIGSVTDEKIEAQIDEMALFQYHVLEGYDKYEHFPDFRYSQFKPHWLDDRSRYNFLVDRALENISVSLLDNPVSQGLPDFVKKDFIRNLFSEFDAKRFSVSEKSLFCYSDDNGLVQPLEVTLSRNGTPLVVVGDRILHQFFAESDILYKDARMDSNVFGGIFDVRNGMDHGECLSVMLDYDLGIDSLKAMAYRFVRQYLNDDDKISFVCGKSSFDYLTDSSSYDRISGESSLKEFFAGLNGVKDNWSPVFDFDYCKAVFELSGSKLKFSAYRGGTSYQPDFVIDAGAKVFPDLKIVVTDKKYNVQFAKERKYNKHAKTKNGLWL